MVILREGARAVREEHRTWLLYLAMSVAISATHWALFRWLQDGGGLAEWPVNRVRLVFFARDVALAALYALVQAVAFARFGRALDRPLWKVNTDGEAIRRFFSLWFILNLAGLASLNVSVQPSYFGFICLFALLVVFAIPVGSCIMFAGRLEWKQAPEMLAPLTRRMEDTVPILLAAGAGLLVQFFVMALMDTRPGLRESYWPLLLVTVVIGSLDCLVFCATWILCQHDRDTQHDTIEF